MDNFSDKQKTIIGFALLMIPGAAVAFGTFLLYNQAKKVWKQREERAQREQEEKQAAIDKLYKEMNGEE